VHKIISIAQIVLKYNFSTSKFALIIYTHNPIKIQAQTKKSLLSRMGGKTGLTSPMRLLASAESICLVLRQSCFDG